MLETTFPDTTDADIELENDSDLLLRAKAIEVCLEVWKHHPKEEQLLVVRHIAHKEICLWSKFRPTYARLGDLKSLVPEAPFVGLTATLTKEALQTTKDKLFSNLAGREICIDEVRTNIRLEVQFLQYRDHVSQLITILKGYQMKTIVYFDSVKLVAKTLQRLKKELPRLRITLYYAILACKFKADIMKLFLDNKIDILLATEAAGMGCDIRDVQRVIQFR
ncbi:hypothetical protein BGZ73_009218, partial [Actinomortierella ambigua]